MLDPERWDNDVRVPEPSRNVTDFPFSVPVSRGGPKGKRGVVTRRDLENIMGDVNRGTNFDMTLGAMSGPFGNPNFLEGGSGLGRVKGLLPRATSIPRTVYGIIGETRQGNT